METKQIKEKEKKFFRDYFNVHKQLTTGNGSTRDSKEILNFFTQLKHLPKEYTSDKWEVGSRIPMCEDIVADEDSWVYKERFLPSLSKNRMQKVNEIKRELLSHSAVILKSNRKEGQQFPLLSNFDYDNSIPIYSNFSSSLPYIELNPSSNFSSVVRRNSLKPLPLENMFKLNDSPAQRGQKDKTQTLFSYVKAESSRHNQQNFQYMFSSDLNRYSFNGSVKQNAITLNKDEKEYKDSTNKICDLMRLVYSYWHKKNLGQIKDKDHFIEELYRIKGELTKMYANPNYSHYAASINNAMKVIEKALIYGQN